MKNKLKWIYNNGTVRAEKYPEPNRNDFPEGLTGAFKHIAALSEWQSYETANIAEADNPYWEIECDIEGERERLLELQADKTRWFTLQEFERLQKLSAIIFDEPIEVTILP